MAVRVLLSGQPLCSVSSYEEGSLLIFFVYVCVLVLCLFGDLFWNVIVAIYLPLTFPMT